MKVKRQLLIVFFAFGFAHRSNAQTNQVPEPISVSLVSGDVEVRSNPSAWEKITLNTHLTARSEIRIKSRGKLILIKTGGFYATIDRSSPYRFIVNLLQFDEARGFFARLIDMYLAGESPHDDLKGTMGKKGGSSRSYPMLIPAANETIGNVPLTFKWLQDNRPNYHLRLEERNGSSKPIADLLIASDTSYTLKDTTLLLPGRTYQWTILPLLSNEQPVYVLFKVGKVPPVNNLNSGLALVNQSALLDPEIKEVFRILCVEDAGSYSEAQEMFLKALARAPSSLLLKKRYTAFLDEVISHNKQKQ